MYLGASLDQVETKGGTKLCSMYTKKYVKSVVVNHDATLAKRYIQLPNSNYTVLTN